MTKDELAILRKIASQPTNHMPRLAYCDWLEERDADEECPECEGTGKRRYTDAAGDADYRMCYSCAGDGRRRNAYARRAEFIRVQIEMAELLEQNDEMAKADISNFDYDRARLNEKLAKKRNRVIDLWQGEQDGHWANVQTQLRPLLHGLWGTIIPGHPAKMPHALVARGFPCQVRCDISFWLAHGPKIVEINPIEKVNITTEPLLNTNFLGQREYYYHLPFATRVYCVSEAEAKTDAGFKLLEWARLIANSPDGRIDPKAFVVPRWV